MVLLGEKKSSFFLCDFQTLINHQFPLYFLYLAKFPSRFSSGEMSLKRKILIRLPVTRDKREWRCMLLSWSLKKGEFPAYCIFWKFMLVWFLLFLVLGIFVEASGYRSRRYELMWPSPPTNIGKLFLLFCSSSCYYQYLVILLWKKVLVRVINENGWIYCSSLLSNLVTRVLS